MRVVLKPGHVVLIGEGEAERAELDAFRQSAHGHVFELSDSGNGGLALADLGRREDACREEINVTSLSPDPAIAILGNFAATPFVLDGRRYASIESFWQGLKFASESDRARLAALDGRSAKEAGGAQSQPTAFAYDGETITTGTWRHWRLMGRANRAKFEQNANAAAALLATGERPLVHVVRPDSKTIPGVIMAQIWMRIRAKLRETPGAA